MTDDHGLNDRQKRFCEFYACNGGNGTQAAIDAGYAPQAARQQAARLLTNANILSYIRKMQEEQAEARILSAQQIKAYWSELIRDENQKTSDRIAASQLLAKSAGLFQRESMQQINVYADADETIIQLPEMLTEAECEWDGPEEK